MRSDEFSELLTGTTWKPISRLEMFDTNALFGRPFSINFAFTVGTDVVSVLNSCLKKNLKYT